MKKYLLGIIILLGILTSGITLAQNFEVEPNITISSSPEDPREGESVTISLTSYETNLDLAYIKWTYGNETKTGYGVKDFNITASPVTGAQNGVKAEITLVNGTKIEKNISFISNSYDILWEALDTKTPPFYLGKKIPIRENSIRVAVLTPVMGRTSYAWSRNGKSFSSGSGNSNFIEFKNTELEKNESVSVAIVKPNEKPSSGSINIPFGNKKILFYEYTPINGVLSGSTTKDIALGHENTVSILAIPLGINKTPKPEIKWTLSGQGVNNQSIPNLISFIKPDNNGVVNLGAEIVNNRSLYQEFNGILNLNF